MNLGKLSGETWHPTMGKVKYNVRGMSSDPDSQVGQTLSLMRERVAEDSDNPMFVSRVRRMFDVRMYPGMRGTGIGKGVIPGTADEMSLCEQAWAHTKQNIKFQRDEVTGEGIAGFPSDEVIETIIRPVDMAQSIDQGGAVGDCDDFSMYLACCLKSLGIPCAFATTAADSRDPQQFSHVYVVAYPMTPSGMRMRMPLDASHGEYPGWETEGLGRFQEWPVLDRLNLFVGTAVMQGLVVVGLVLLFKHFSGRFV